MVCPDTNEKPQECEEGWALKEGKCTKEGEEAKDPTCTDKKETVE